MSRISSPMRIWSLPLPTPATSSASRSSRIAPRSAAARGVSGVNLKEDDVIDEMFIASTHEYVLFFSTKGEGVRLKVHELPEGTRQARGTAIVNLLPFEDGEKIASVISCREFPEDEYLMFATAHGMVKKTAMAAYDRSRRDGIIAINIKDGDRLLGVRRRSRATRSSWQPPPAPSCLARTRCALPAATRAAFAVLA